jgi:tRNA threonylcarbamoyladenosine biosynthesis protein TsaE
MALAAAIGSKVRGGEVFELQSDLGGGKTAFVIGLAKGMGSSDDIHSASFTILNLYKTAKADLFHFDFYRLKDPGIMRDEIAEVVADGKAVVAVEWAEIIKDVLPVDHISVSIVVSGESERRFKFSYPEKFNYLFPSPANT